MIIKHVGFSPKIDPTAYVAPNAVVCGDVTLGPGSCVMFGAQVIAESGPICIGHDCIIMENAVLRATSLHPLLVGDNCLVGSNAYLVGCTLEDEVFIATCASVFHAAHLGKGCEVRIHAVVDIKSWLPPGTVVPIGWIAIGSPASVIPCSDHDRIWAIQEPLDFPRTVFGFDRAEASMQKITRRLSQALRCHASDNIEADVSCDAVPWEGAEAVR